MNKQDLKKIIKEEVQNVLNEQNTVKDNDFERTLKILGGASVIQNELMPKLSKALAAYKRNVNKQTAYTEMQTIINQMFKKLLVKNSKELTADIMKKKIVTTGPVRDIAKLVGDYADKYGKE
jgi:seryl-tRNA synthetase